MGRDRSALRDSCFRYARSRSHHRLPPLLPLPPIYFFLTSIAGPVRGAERRRPGSSSRQRKGSEAGLSLVPDSLRALTRGIARCVLSLVPGLLGQIRGSTTASHRRTHHRGSDRWLSTWSLSSGVCGESTLTSCLTMYHQPPSQRAWWACWRPWRRTTATPR